MMLREPTATLRRRWPRRRPSRPGAAEAGPEQQPGAAVEVGDPPAGPREAVVLSGGGSLGAVQVGALLALRDAGIEPDVWIGCSVGALNAAYLACSTDPDRFDLLAGLWGTLTSRDIFPTSRVGLPGAVCGRSSGASTTCTPRTACAG